MLHLLRFHVFCQFSKFRYLLHSLSYPLLEAFLDICWSLNPLCPSFFLTFHGFIFLYCSGQFPQISLFSLLNHSSDVIVKLFNLAFETLFHWVLFPIFQLSFIFIHICLFFFRVSFSLKLLILQHLYSPLLHSIA